MREILFRDNRDLSFTAKQIEEKCCLSLYLFALDNVEVVGNIHDNPEWLGGNSE